MSARGRSSDRRGGRPDVGATFYDHAPRSDIRGIRVRGPAAVDPYRKAICWPDESSADNLERFYAKIRAANPDLRLVLVISELDATPHLRATPR